MSSRVKRGAQCSGASVCCGGSRRFSPDVVRIFEGHLARCRPWHIMGQAKELPELPPPFSVLRRVLPALSRSPVSGDAVLEEAFGVDVGAKTSGVPLSPQ